MTSSPSSALLSALQYGPHLAVRVHAVTVPPLVPIRGGLHFAFLIDTSGSMRGERLDAVKRTLHAARPQLCPTDRVTLVTFSSVAKTIVKSLPMNEEGQATLFAAVDALADEGATNMSAGFEELLRGVTDYDMILLLTDGQVNDGIKSTTGLYTMAVTGFPTVPFHVFGYGADHNHVLARDIAVRSCGTYTYINDESLLPIAVGDIVAGLRSEVLRNASVVVSGAWTSMELGGSGRIGGVVPDRDYWMVFVRPAALGTAPTHVTLRTAAGVVATLTEVPVCDCHELREQVLRCRVVSLVANSSTTDGRATATELLAEIAAAGESFQQRPLVARLGAQIAEYVESLSVARPDLDLLSRLTSGTVYMCNQRGVTRPRRARRHRLGGADDSDEDEPQAHTALFSSPLQREVSTQVHTVFASSRA